MPRRAEVRRLSCLLPALCPCCCSVMQGLTQPGRDPPFGTGAQPGCGPPGSVMGSRLLSVAARGCFLGPMGAGVPRGCGDGQRDVLLALCSWLLYGV